MYSLKSFGSMIRDDVRMRAYVKAMQRAIRPGAVVLDIGTGTGIMAFIACQLGARRVVAVEPNDLIHVAEDMARANGYLPQIEFIKDLSTNLSLDEKADVILSDLRGALPLFEQHIPSLVDARARLLKPGGVLIPHRDSLWLAAVEAPKPYRELVAPWQAGAFHLDMQIARRMVLNEYEVYRPESASDLLTAPACWAVLDYATVESPHVSGRVRRKILRPGTAHGLQAWFNAELFPGVEFHNRPGAKRHPQVYGSVFFPFLEPLPVAAGDLLEVAMQANLVDDAYVWSWETRLRTAGGGERAHFQQSSFFSQRWPRALLQKNDLAYRPACNREGEIDRFIIESMTGAASVAEIARRVVAKFPGRFKDPRDASARVSRLARKYTD